MGAAAGAIFFIQVALDHGDLLEAGGDATAPFDDCSAGCGAA